MARLQKFEISGLNIVTQPHSSDGYVNLFKRLIGKEPRYVKVRGNDCLMVSSVRPLDSNNWNKGIYGEIIKFSEIEQDRNWVNVSDRKIIEDGEEPQLPKYMKPNGASFPYIFYPSKKGLSHKLFYISHSRNHKGKYDSLSPNLLKKMFDFLFNNEIVLGNYDSVEVTVLPDSDTLNTILTIPNLQKLELLIKTPNPDDLDEAEQSMFRRMDEMNVGKIFEEYSGNEIIPDDVLKLKAKVAANNGYVKGIGKDIDGIKIDISTKDEPLRKSVFLDPLYDTVLSVLERFRL